MDQKHTFLLILLILVLSACSVSEITEVPGLEEIVTTDALTPTAGYPIETEAEALSTGYPVETGMQAPATAYPVAIDPQSLDLRSTADMVINALADKDMVFMAKFVHPEEGLRFSPYAFVREEHRVFIPGELPGLVGAEDVYTWGTYDGSGEAIELTFDEYYQDFIYSSDFANPEQIAVNERIGQGNTINNISDFYPEGSFFEYHFSGFEEAYGGLDWESLRLVFVQEGGAWWLVGIVHDEWTI